MQISDYILPILFLIIFIYALIKKMPAYDYFVSGAKSAVDVTIGIFPYLAAVLVMVHIFRLSGLASTVADFLSPVYTFFGIPPEIAELTFLRPFTGSGSLAVLDNIYSTYGADSYIARCASVFAGSTDTVFYIAVVYFSTTKVKKLRYAIPLSLLVTFFTAVLACLLCRIM